MPIYLGARDLKGVPVGRHQFIVIINNSLLSPRDVGGEKVQARDLGGGQKGVVVGAQNRGNLVVEFFNSSDYKAAKEYFGGVTREWYESDFDTYMIEVGFGDVRGSLAVNKILGRIEAYLLNQRVDSIKYPTAGIGVNSNSWTQSVIEYSGGEVREDLPGLDISNDKRIPKTYFEPYCPVAPRPKVNAR